MNLGRTAREAGLTERNERSGARAVSEGTGVRPSLSRPWVVLLWPLHFTFHCRDETWGEIPFEQHRYPDKIKIRKKPRNFFFTISTLTFTFKCVGRSKVCPVYGPHNIYLQVDDKITYVVKNTSQLLSVKWNDVIKVSVPTQVSNEKFCVCKLNNTRVLFHCSPSGLYIPCSRMESSEETAAAANQLNLWPSYIGLVPTNTGQTTSRFFSIRLLLSL